MLSIRLVSNMGRDAACSELLTIYHAGMTFMRLRITMHLFGAALGLLQALALGVLHIGDQLLICAPHEFIAQTALGRPCSRAAGVIALLPAGKLPLQLRNCHARLRGHLSGSDFG